MSILLLVNRNSLILITVATEQKMLTCEANVAKCIFMSRCGFSTCKFSFEIFDNKLKLFEQESVNSFEFMLECLNFVIIPICDPLEHSQDRFEIL